MTRVEELEREVKTLRERLSRSSEASRRIIASLDLETVLQDVLDSARELTRARYGVLTLLDREGNIQNRLSSGLTPEQSRQLWEMREGMGFFEYLSGIRQPLRLLDFTSHIVATGLPEPRMPMPTSSTVTFLAAPIRHGDEFTGAVYLAEQLDGREFTQEDEDTLVTFASQAALVIANAKSHADAQRARIDLQTVIDTSPVGIAVFDARNGELTSINREAIRIAEGLRPDGRSVEELLKILNVKRGDGREFSLHDPSFARMLSAGEAVRAEEVVIETPSGERLTVVANATPIRSCDGSIKSFVVTLHDMTPIEELEHMRAEFLAMVSHELRVPLASVKGAVTTLLDDGFSLSEAEMGQYLRIMNQQANHMVGMINDLLDVARIGTGTLQVALEPNDVAGLADQARNAMLTMDGMENVRFEIAPDLPWVMADRRRIVQVLTNLLSNAARHASGRAPILVSAARKGIHVSVAVTDGGEGVSPERLQHLFRKFPATRDGTRGGSGENGDAGWGLAICRGIVEAHGGRIWAESDGVGQGTRFTFTLPVAEKDNYVAVDGSAATAGHTLSGMAKKTRILVVDDDPQTLQTVRRALSDEGFFPVMTGDPTGVKRLMEKHRPRLVLMDLVLPESDGISLMQSIFEDVELPVIFLSAYGHEDAVARALDAGAADYVVKPFTPTELMARVRAALRGGSGPGQAEPEEPFVLGALTIDYAPRAVSVAGKTVRMTDVEFRLLAELSMNAGRLLTYEHLMQRVWGEWQSHDTARLRATVKNVRRKLGDRAGDPVFIFNEPRVGYRLGSIE